MSTASLGLYFRSFLVKLSMMESILGPLGLGGNLHLASSVVLRLTTIKTMPHLP